ncbi:hypothetical protein EH223_15560 [candidate division KSB1 bacterium]|nr:hypothetical protein [candidate division KSB1 bacterium]RQW01333.1 MAG: hypothetical protein EH223_15560 [candidate division KSB1 bacterium]
MSISNDSRPIINEYSLQEKLTPQQMDAAWARGWRHFGSYFFRYNISGDENSRVVLPLRIRLAVFTPTKSQRRIVRKNRDLKMVVRDAFLDDEKLALFDRHKTRFIENVPTSLTAFIGEQPATVPCVTKEICLFKYDHLVGASFWDIGHIATSSIYAMFDPEESKKSLGIYLILLSVKLSQQAGKKFYYHGYAYKESSFYDYKKRFTALEYYNWQGDWLPLERDQFNQKKGNVMNGCNFKSVFIVLIFIMLFSACTKDAPVENGAKPAPPTKSNDFLVDSLATTETVALFEKLKTVSPTGVLFGHQDDLAYGIGWQAEPGRSDIKSVCGDYPAVYGCDLGDIQNEANLDGVLFENMKRWIKEAHSRGGINTISLHLDNPVTRENAWDNSPAVKYILPNQSHHASYIRTLDQIAAFLKDLHTDNGTFIPIILRPYHEHNHTWSWWGQSACTAEEYNALWTMTVEHLRDTHAIHHLLYAISPQEISSEAQYLQRYPGDAWVDILGMDYYLLWDKSRIAHLGKGLEVIARMAEARGKVSALTEVGIDKVPISDWWTNYLLAAILYNDDSRKTAWALVWRNASVDHFFAPYPGHASAADFVKFYQHAFTIFEQELSEH